MRTFAHPPTTIVEPVNINQAIKTTLIVAANDCNHVAEVTCDLGEIPLMQGNAGDLNQVLLNVIIDASHAIADLVGDLTSRRRNDQPPPRPAPDRHGDPWRGRGAPDLQAALSAKTPLVIGVVMALGFLLLLIALQAPLLAAVGVLTNLLASGAAFGVAKWIFQDGALHSLLGFQPQGFLDAWGPVFFFAMIFAISMDYTVFLLSSAKEHWDRTHDARDAMVGGNRTLRTRDLRNRRRDGRRVLHLRALRAATAEGDGDHPRHRGAARRRLDQAAAAAARAAAADGQVGVVPAALGAPVAPRRHVRPRVIEGGGAMSATLELWQTEWFPASHRVRQRLTELGVSFVAHQVAVDPAARAQLWEATGQTTIPILVSGDGEILTGEQAILTYLTEQFTEPSDASTQREKGEKARRKQLEEACPKLAAATH